MRYITRTYEHDLRTPFVMPGNGAVCTFVALAVSTDSSPSTQERIRQERLSALCFGAARSFLQIQAARRLGCPPRPPLRMITYLLGTLPNLLFALVVVILPIRSKLPRSPKKGAIVGPSIHACRVRNTKKSGKERALSDGVAH
jgi:hypothetical protein